MNPETFELYRVNHPGDVDVVPLTAAEAAELKQVVLDHMNHEGEPSEDIRVRAIGRVAYERSGSGTRSYSSSIDAVLSELVADPPADGSAEAASGDDAVDEPETDKPAPKAKKGKKAAAAAPGDDEPAKGE